MKWKKTVCLTMALLLTLSCLPAAEAEEEDVIRIRSAEDLCSLSDRCSLDSWSEGKTVLLENDISLSGSGFESIPVFSGRFDGQGYSIRDLELTGGQSPCGLFLETGPDAVISDLQVYGTVFPQEDDSRIGGIVGLNRGTVTRCRFTGQTAGKSQVGGIAGENCATGIISECVSSGTVTGLKDTGGIAGKNSGTILACENSSFVNTESVDPAVRLDSIDTSSILNFLRSFTSDNAGVTVNTGGIAGSNTGFLEQCRNSGTVGYLHLGYNVGGVAGRSDGYVNGCTNYGVVYGRKDTGGIVGQAEPFVDVEEAQNLLSGLQYRMNALNASVSTAIRDAEAVSGQLAGQLSGLPADLASVREMIYGLDPTDPASLDLLRGALASAVSGISSKISGMSENMDGSSDVMMEDLRRISDDLNALSGAAMQAMSLLSGAENSESILTDESSAGTADSVTLGKIRDCCNEGSVFSDSNAGGIAGSVSLENEEDQEQDLYSSENPLVQKHYSFSAVILQCVSRGEISVKRTCAGGICGRLDLGYISNCSGFGTVAVEEGEYAGGICGLCYGTINACCVKCRLSGEKYVGGIVGCGYSGKTEETCSLVSGCYGLTEILDKPQYSGAISGGAEGVFRNNYFVPEGFAGMDRLSIRGQAEPMEFEEFSRVEGLPEECTSFLLSFAVDGKTVKTVPFAYGDSFDRSVFPETEIRDGVYAVWDRTDLTDLHFDTEVTASYRMEESVLRSEEERPDGRAVLYVDGQFQKGDSLTLEQLPTEEIDLGLFRGNWRQTIRDQLRSIFRDRDPDYTISTGLSERLRFSFPEDGNTTHTLRYLTPDGKVKDYRVYLKNGENWERVRPEQFGSYLIFSVPGNQGEMMLVSAIQSWWIVLYIIGGLMLAAAIVWLWAACLKRWKQYSGTRKRKGEKKKSRLRLWCKEHRKTLRWAVPLVLAAAMAVGLAFCSGSIRNTVDTYRLLKDFAGEETDILTEVSIRSEQRDIRIDTCVHRISCDGKMVGCAEQFGIPVYISEGKIWLENGRAFRLAESHMDQTSIMDLAGKVFRSGKIRRSEQEDGTLYETVIQGETGDEILRVFLSEEYQGIVHVREVTVRLEAGDDRIRSLSFEGEGETESGTLFTLQASLTPRAMEERPTVPDPVLKAMAGEQKTTEVLSADLLALLAAWIKNDSAREIDADVAVRVDCGALQISRDYAYFRTLEQDRKIHCLKSSLFAVYFTDSAACMENGKSLTEAAENMRDTAGLITLARDLCLKGEFSCEKIGNSRRYTLLLSPEAAGEMVGKLLPEVQGQTCSYDDCRLEVLIRNDEMEQIRLNCGGTVRVVTRDVEIGLELKVLYRDPQVHTVPFRVLQVLKEAE